jgi:hypothetical protein
MQLDEGPRDDLGELQLDTEGVPPNDPGEPRRSSYWPLIWVVLLLMAAVLGVYFGFFRGRDEPAPEEPAVEAPSPSPAPAPKPEAPVAIEIPPLDASDPLVRQLLTELVEHPKLAAWLTPDELVRRFVAAVDNIAEGRSPRQAIGHLEPDEEFTVLDREGLAVVDPASYERYDAIASLFASLDTADMAELYRTLSPLFDEAYRDLGYPDRNFDETFGRAVGVLTSTPIPSGEVVLTPKVDTYQYVDPSLEKLTPPQKALLRMGPENGRALQRKLGEVADELGLDR